MAAGVSLQNKANTHTHTPTLARAGVKFLPDTENKRGQIQAAVS